MRIEWAIPCRQVDLSAGVATLVGADTNVFGASSFPAVVALEVAIKIAADEHDDGDHMLRSQVLGPDMKPVAVRAPTRFEMGTANPAKPAGWEQTELQSLAVRFPAVAEGQYTLELSVDDRTKLVPLLVLRTS